MKKNYICCMKILNLGFLILFITFLATPSLIVWVDEEVNTSYFYSMAEEEENHAPFNEIKSIPTLFKIPLAIDFEGLQKVQFSILNFRKVNSMKPNVFHPPPELV